MSVPVSDTPARSYTRLTAWGVALVGAILLALWLLGTPPGVLGKADAVGYAICHRIAERAFHIHDRPLPLCARCTGIYLGVMTGLAVYAARGRLRASQLPPIKFLAALALWCVWYAADGLNSYLTFFEFYTPIYQPHNTLRLITGMGFGLAMITVILPVFNTILWKNLEAAAPLRRWSDLALLVGIAVGVVIVVLLELPAVLITAAIVSAAGVLFMFSVVGCTVFLMFTRRENTLVGWRDLVLPQVSGLVFALAVIASIDLARYLFTGTW
ncbi:MAG: DUF2085 domain-containing protein, partial [Chloroflexi bacterium]|nr:DUF2085 domain-containing protein [Chloroflexota bacterium]